MSHFSERVEILCVSSGSLARINGRSHSKLVSSEVFRFEFKDECFSSQQAGQFCLQLCDSSEKNSHLNSEKFKSEYLTGVSSNNYSSTGLERAQLISLDDRAASE